ncbi:hypothetical protein SDC9_115155 [bioreactor metagenome]|uniref:Uncharacterized protein n=1 Tax=bioreactor metagenome TaxID=1076179 RepID=A0A645C2M3_9ZZZZ
MENTKNIVVKFNSIKLLGLLLIGVGLVLFINTYISINPTESSTANNNSGGIIGVIVGSVFFILGNRKRQISFSEDKIEYLNSKLVFSTKYGEINLIKTFIDPANKSENLMIFVDENKTISFSSSFFNKDILQNIYTELLFRCKEFIDKDEITVDNDLNW